MWVSKQTNEIKGFKLFRQTTTLIDEKIYLQGGCDQNIDFIPTFSSFDFKSNNWETISVPTDFSSRAGHTVFFYKGCYYSVGGLENTIIHKTKIFRFNLETKKVDFIVYKGDLMIQFGHTLVLYKGKVFLFGGATDMAHMEQQSNDTFMYDIEENTVRKLQTNNENILPRESHNAILYKDQMIVFGGRSKDNRFNQVLSLTLDNEKKYEWKILKNNGDVPSKRATCSIGLVKDSFYIFGGFDGKNELCDLYSYNLKNQFWKKIYILGKYHPKVSLHSDVFIEKNGKVKWFIFGGMIKEHVYEEVYVIEADLAIFNCYNNDYLDVTFKFMS